MRGDDNRFPLGEAGLDDLLLHDRKSVIIDLDPQIPPGDHDAVGLAHDVDEISDCGLILDLRDDARLGAVFLEQGAQGSQIRGFPRKGEGKKIDPERSAEEDVLAVFLGEGGQIHLHARQIDVPSGAESAGNEDLAAGAGFRFLEDFQLDQAAVDKEGVAGLDVGGEARIIHTDAGHAVVAVSRIGGRHEIDGIPGIEVDALLEVGRANLRTFHIHHDGHLPPDILRDAAHAFDDTPCPLGIGVGHVQAHDVDTGRDEPAQFLPALGCRTQRGDDLRVTKRFLHGLTMSRKSASAGFVSFGSSSGGS